MPNNHGKNNERLTFAAGLEWLPNIRRQDYRNYGLLGTIGRGENGPVVQEIPKYQHIVNLFSLSYDKGSRIVGMIEERLGEAPSFDFLPAVHPHHPYPTL